MPIEAAVQTVAAPPWSLRWRGSIAMTVAIVGATLGLPAAFAEAGSPPSDVAIAPPPTASQTVDVPTINPPLDPRVEAARERITDLPEAEPPRRIVQPLPAFHRIAETPDAVAMDPDVTRRALDAMHDGLRFLRARQAADGSWMATIVAVPTDQPNRPAPVTVAVTALAVKAISQSRPESAPLSDADADALERAVAFLHRWRTDDATWGAGPLASYVHACVAMGLAATRDHRLRELVDESVEFLTSAQWDEREGVSPRQDWYGGAGYGRHGRPDLSNTQLMLDALHDAGVSADDPAVQRAVAFVTRTQNLRATNPAEWAQAGPNDGGFVYTPANGGESFASEDAGEGRYGEIRAEGAPRTLRSYGSMTYAGLKSLLYAGLDQDDPRVISALGWIRRHITFDENPGLGQQGLYYYYHAMARALVAAQQPLLRPEHDGEGSDDLDDQAVRTVNWRELLVDALLERQRDDGGWRNDTTRWLEGETELATIYALLSLQECLKPAAK